MRFAAEESQTRGVGISEIRAEISLAIHQSRDIVKLEDDERGVRRYTTRTMLRIESHLLASVKRSEGNDNHRVAAPDVAAAIRQHPSIEPEQAEAVRHITQGEDSITAVNGFAGTGKTFMLSVAKSIWEASGYDVVGTALAAKAAKTIENDSGIPSTHIHRLLCTRSVSEQRTLKENVLPSEFVAIEEPSPTTGVHGYFLSPGRNPYARTVPAQEFIDVIVADEKEKKHGIIRRPDSHQSLIPWTEARRSALGITLERHQPQKSEPHPGPLAQFANTNQTKSDNCSDALIGELSLPKYEGRLR